MPSGFFFALFYHLSESKAAENQAEIELTINLLAHMSNCFIHTIWAAKSSSKGPCYTFEVTRTQEKQNKSTTRSHRMSTSDKDQNS